jgi:hypothetical protein
VKAQGRKQTESRQDLTTGENLALEIARLFPDEFRVWGNRVSVKENVGRESTRREVSANLGEMYAAADAERAEARRKRHKKGKP